MTKRSLLVWGMLVAGGLSCATRTTEGSAAETAPSAEQRVLPFRPSPVDGKPGAPIRIDFTRDVPALVGGSARIDYAVTPIVDALDIEVVVSLPQGGAVRWHNAPARGAAARNEERIGAFAVDLPTGLPGVEVTVDARIEIPDPDAPSGTFVYTNSRTVTWGTPDRPVTGVTPDVSNGELVLDTPATRLGGE